MSIIIGLMELIMELADAVPRWAGRRKLQPTGPHSGARGNRSGSAEGAASLRVQPLLTAARRRCPNSSCCGNRIGAAVGTALLPAARQGLAELRRGGHGGCGCGGVAAGEHLGVTPALKQKAWLWDHRLHIVNCTRRPATGRRRRTRCRQRQDLRRRGARPA